MKGSTAAPPPAMPNKTSENMLPKPLRLFDSSDASGLYFYRTRWSMSALGIFLASAAQCLSGPLTSTVAAELFGNPWNMAEKTVFYVHVCVCFVDGRISDQGTCGTRVIQEPGE